MPRLIYASVRHLMHRLFHRQVCHQSLIPLNRKVALTFRKTFLFSKYAKSMLSTMLSTPESLVGEKNIVLLGAPGAGKTTVAVLIGQITGLPVIDINEILEKTWHMSVAQKLQEVGEELFLQEEGEVVQKLSTVRGVISLTGSNPMHLASMNHVKKNGIIVYLDVSLEDILERLEGMNIDHIVGLRPGVSMQDIFQYRQQFYHQWYHVRVLCQAGDTAETIAVKVLDGIKRYQDSKSGIFVSTRSVNNDSEFMQNPSFFTDVVIEDLALDGGLFVPADPLPELTAGEWQRLVETSYTERAQILLEKFIHPNDVPAINLREMVMKAYGQNFSCNKIAPVRHLSGSQFLLELFYGPTASFMDFALQMLPQLFAYCMPRTCNYLILVVTSGDTGCAVLDGFLRLSDADKQRIAILAFFPEERMSQVQKAQMISYKAENVKFVGVKSNFDFCQMIVKQIFTNSDYTGFLTVEYGTALYTANSTNWACLLPKVVYHASSYLDLINQGVITFGDPIDVCIPTGNFDNILAAVYAKYMGIPIRKFICASNQDATLTDFIRTGKYDLRHGNVTAFSPTLDVLKASNIERYLHLVSQGDGLLMTKLFSQLKEQYYFQVPNLLLERIQHDFMSDWCSEGECLDAIYSVYRSTGYILDPDTAMAKLVADRQHDGTCPVVVVSTAHPCKSAAAVLQALKAKEISQRPIDQLQMLNSLNSIPSIHNAVLERIGKAHTQDYQVCPADPSDIMDIIERFIYQKFMCIA
ncbi:threonine synthase-like 1 [Hemiscyllium ocellatum]|uniref:threonine synthase-like 1 n=1 Tax=Hemiscyllium ocellatum TaxID=170820 RepID=UPI0029675E6A|nr:threonine synthase-like 1 [Hemiscyllium ocellatum]XP_060681563.1 threonine synthase-like 1 [Hemiscyllium ocellatum]XP_060681564.1 threonine synthase-like 1 [Hemiscyllium ocellatum]XP_060681565.1 threonine synthase-like 1 [Hemiscyllium ocellatum]